MPGQLVAVTAASEIITALAKDRGDVLSAVQVVRDETMDNTAATTNRKNRDQMTAVANKSLCNAIFVTLLPVSCPQIFQWISSLYCLASMPGQANH